MALGYLGGSSLFIPSHDATNGLVVGFSRNPASFPITKYLKMIPTKKNQGVYLRWGSDDAARVVSDDAREYLWARGADEPHGADETEVGEWVPFVTNRYRFGFSIDDDTPNLSDFPILAAYAAQKAQKAMTVRTMHAHAALTAASWGTQTATVATITGTGGDDWSKGTKTNPIILNSLNYAAASINLNTLGTVNPGGMTLVINPNLAKKMAASAEIRDYMAQSPFAEKYLTMDGGMSGRYGLPAVFYDYNIVVENAVRVTSKKKAAPADADKSFVMGDTVAYLLSRPDGIEGVEGAPNFSTIHMYWYRDEMTVETKADPDARRIKGRVISDYKMVVPSVYSGFRFTAA